MTVCMRIKKVVKEAEQSELVQVAFNLEIPKTHINQLLSIYN